MQSNLVVNILEGEYWWGGTVQDGIFMPYKDKEFSRDLSKEQLGNQSTPFLVSSKGRYLWCEEPLKFSFREDKLLVSSELGKIIFSEGHKTLREAFRQASKNYFPPEGRYPDPLLFTAPQYNTWIEMMYEPTQEKILAYARSILENGMAPGVLMIDDNWQEDYGVWNFHPGRFPEPKAMIEELHRMGFKVMLWVCNFISPDSLTSRTISKMDYLVKNKEGSPAIVQCWNGYSCMLDVSNEEAVNWFKGKLNNLVKEYGVDGFKLDAGDMSHFNSEYICNKQINANDYSEIWARIGLDYELNEYRACWKLAGKALVQRLSDKNHSWELKGGLGSLIPNGLAQGILGYAFTCPDMIGGGEYVNFLENSNTLDMELVVRNAQCAALFPMMQFSVAPWRILDKEHLEYCVQMARLHKQLGGEIIELAKEGANTGEPIIRHMEYVFPKNHYETIRDQFMLGDNILVAPVLVKGAVTKTVVFPEGKWIGDDRSVVEGPCIKEVEAPLSRLPWYRRA